MLALFSFLFALLAAVATAVTIGVSTDPAYIVPLSLFCVSATFTAKPAIDYLRDC